MSETALPTNTNVLPEGDVVAAAVPVALSEPVPVALRKAVVVKLDEPVPVALDESVSVALALLDGLGDGVLVMDRPTPVELVELVAMALKDGVPVWLPVASQKSCMGASVSGPRLAMSVPSDAMTRRISPTERMQHGQPPLKRKVTRSTGTGVASCTANQLLGPSLFLA